MECNGHTRSKVTALNATSDGLALNSAYSYRTSLVSFLDGALSVKLPAGGSVQKEKWVLTCTQALLHAVQKSVWTH